MTHLSGFNLITECSAKQRKMCKKCQRMMLVVCGSIILSSVATVSGVSEFYCSSAVQNISGVTDGVIVTRKNGSQFYGNDLECIWMIDAGIGHQIQLVVEKLDLQWSPEYASCFEYDNIQILEGPSKKSPVLTTLCHAWNIYSLLSKGQHLHLTFTSDDFNFYNHEGIRIRFRTFKNGSCPPDWFQVSPDSLHCLMIGQPGTAGWSRAQDICNMNRANLASILSESELKAILEHARNISDSLNYAWIGLHDKDQSYKWIDRQPFSFASDIVGKRYNTHCIAQDFTTEKWQAFTCDSSQNYICKARKDGNTVLFQAEPSSPPPKEEEGTKLYMMVIFIVIPLILLASIGAVLFYCCYWRRRKAGAQKKSPSAKREEARTEERSAAAAELTPMERRTSQPTAPPLDTLLYDPQQVAPPTYEESQYHPVSPSTY